jgi:hypothetical protein
VTETRVHKGPTFEVLQIGPVAAGLLIAAGVEMLIAALSRPCAWAFVDAVNYIIRVGRLQVVGPGPIYVSTVLVAFSGVPAIVVLLCGLGFGAWLCPSETTASSNSQ